MNADHLRDSEAVQVRPVGDPAPSRPAWLEAPMVQWEAPFVDGSPGTTTCTVPQWTVGKFKVNRVTGCWEWCASRTQAGYGVGYHPKVGRQESAHRMMQEYMRPGSTPGMCVLHSCDNPPCVNPDHLRAGTDADNVRDRISRGRSRYAPLRGILSPKSKLSAEQVAECRASRESSVILAKKFGVSRNTITNARYGKTFSDIAGSDRRPESQRRLSAADIAQIRDPEASSFAAMADRMGVSLRSLMRARHRDTYKDLP